MTTKPYYAHEVIPTVTEKALTLHGFLSQKKTTYRKEWYSFLALSDYDLLQAMKKMQPVSAENNAMTQDQVDGFYRMLIKQGRAELMFTSIEPSDPELVAYRQGLFDGVWNLNAPPH